MYAFYELSVGYVEDVFKCGFLFKKFAGFKVRQAEIRVKLKRGEELKVAPI